MAKNINVTQCGIVAARIVLREVESAKLQNKATTQIYYLVRSCWHVGKEG